MDMIWTIAGDETSWSEWANQMASSSVSETVRQLAFDLKPGDHHWAVDIGCGTGRSFLPLNENEYRVIGIDPIYEAVSASQSRVKRESLLAWPVLASASHLPIKHKSVSAVFAIGTLFHLGPAELEYAILEIKRVLHVGGEAVLHFLDHRDWRQKLGSQISGEEILIPSYQAVVTYFCSESVMREIIGVSGLTIRHSFQKVQKDDEGERRDWFFHCVRQR